jgi:anti-anti-sigma regulatory factor
VFKDRLSIDPKNSFSELLLLAANYTRFTTSRELTLDLTNVEFNSSTGITAFLTLVKNVKSENNLFLKLVIKNKTKQLGTFITILHQLADNTKNIQIKEV